MLNILTKNVVDSSCRLRALDRSYAGIRIRKGFVQITGTVIFGPFELYMRRNILFQGPLNK